MEPGLKAGLIITIDGESRTFSVITNRANYVLGFEGLNEVRTWLENMGRGELFREMFGSTSEVIQ